MLRLNPFVASGIILVLTSPAFATETPPVLVEEPKLVAAPMRSIEISQDLAEKVGQKVWLNETGGDREAITAWNTTEDFASLGIGHFIWFSEGLDTRFRESFPAMLEFLRSRGAKPPAWLDVSPVPPCPWKTQQEFRREFYSPKMTSLRRFLLETVDLQVQYLAQRTKAALPKILDSLPNADDRLHVRRQFYRLVGVSQDLYPLIDYINFKGEGISDKETFPNRRTGEPEGWGLKDVLLAMNGTSEDPKQVLAEFADAARFALKRRISNNPPDKRWQRGWLARVETYRRPLR
ncbi:MULTISPECIES: hypothetical protein [Filomicrobium]|uniref:hypothetical protein n=1 Tax=Filomicrobium TaxID=119044 RepID=UPI001260241D|nr:MULTISPECIES: hypothetical protein [Filomicrobium]